ncbi:hypothetical protein F0562_021319 [Nyssa sinensis]|uniref:Leucine-rich repeat-containing N-terminal plant-type domain-containing protein n=1 Tax=Nyssa sinensis TaxID=561372 RepID=A0A5J5BKM7_9ASTE|nr:hypothetical protein F0562_021319 [Nyssa sinensis]
MKSVFRRRGVLLIAVIHLLSLFQCSFFTFAILDPLDFLALQSIRKALDCMPGSNYFSSWDFTSDPCNFAGVYCDGDKVIALNLGDPRAGSPGLTGRLDPAIGKLSALVEFTVVPGRIFGTLPQTLSRLKNLRFLAVSRNFLSGEIPAGSWSAPGTRNSRSQLQSAQRNTFLCPGTGWTGPVDRLLTGLNRLNYLDLSMNRFTGNIPGNVFTFPITSLQLQRNSFSGPVKPIDQVTITTVDLSYNLLSGQISPLFSTVQDLYLNNNRFTGQVPGSLVDRLLAASMQILYLQHNYLTGIAINPTADIPLSSSLCLQYNCMVPPLDTPCPLKVGKRKTRPPAQCR